jgi:hypothetical protein
MNYNTLFPALAVRASGAGASALGAVTAASGLGALTGALYMARRKGVAGLAKLAGHSSWVFGLALVALGCTQSFVVLLGCVYVTGLSLILVLASGNTLIQTTVEDDKRGRVMSIFSFALLGIAPFGSLVMGWLAEHLGLTVSLALSGAACIVGGAVYLRRYPRG